MDGNQLARNNMEIGHKTIIFLMFALLALTMINIALVATVNYNVSKSVSGLSTIENIMSEWELE